jgi:hypothetical protein
MRNSENVVSPMLKHHSRIPRVDLVPEAGAGTVKFEVRSEPFRIHVSGQPKFQYWRIVTADGASNESRAASKHGIRGAGDTQ